MLSKKLLSRFSAKCYFKEGDLFDTTQLKGEIKNSYFIESNSMKLLNEGKRVLFFWASWSAQSIH